MNREEAIKVLNSRPYTGEVREALETLIPELKESEDEKIRKYLIEKLKVAKSVGELLYTIPQPTREECIVYLEKQKEHQSNSDAPNESSWAGIISSSDKDKNLDEIAQDYVDGVKEYNSEPTWDLIQTAVCYGYHLGANHQVLDNEHLLSAIQVQFASHAKVENGKRYAKLTWDEFKKIIFELFESIRPQSKIHYWTEEEIEPIISDYLTGKEHYGGMIARLRCLKPKSSWKPSEEELVALKRAGGILHDYGHSELAKMVFMIEGELANLPVLNKSMWKPSEEQMDALEKAWLECDSKETSVVLSSLMLDLQKLL